MIYRRMGQSGLKLSELSLGSWLTYGSHIDEAIATECMSAAYDAGVNFFDCAESYGRGKAETVLGNVFRKTAWRRESYVVSTKYFWGLGLEGPNDRGLSRKRIMEGMNGSLKRLGLDYVDIVYCHRPDLDTPIEETVHAMHDLIAHGKALYWGTSEWTAEQIREAWHVADRHHLHKPQVEQPQYNMLHRERVEKDYHRLYDGIGLGLTTFSPLASGLLTGKYYGAATPQGSRLGTPALEWLKTQTLIPDHVAKIKHLAELARDLGCTRAQLALAWCLKNPRVSSVITGASRADQVKENLRAPEFVSKLTAEVIERIEGVLANRPEIERY
jgi:voltage-dependent potassium channel beta subunit